MMSPKDVALTRLPLLGARPTLFWTLNRFRLCVAPITFDICFDDESKGRCLNKVASVRSQANVILDTKQIPSMCGPYHIALFAPMRSPKAVALTRLPLLGARPTLFWTLNRFRLCVAPITLDFFFDGEFKGRCLNKAASVRSQ